MIYRIERVSNSFKKPIEEAVECKDNSGYVVDITSLEQLQKITQKYGDIIIYANQPDDNDIICIYDDYVE